MFVRTRILLALTAIGLATGGAVAATQLPAPIVSASTLTLRTADSVGVVILWTKRCIGTSCPQAWDLELTRKTKRGFVLEADRRLTRLRDTVRMAKPECPPVGAVTIDTALISVRAVGGSVGTAKLALRCRYLTFAEIAHDAALLDSFPLTNRRTTTGDYQYGPNGDSLRLTGRGDTISVFKGYTWSLCRLARNRYTGAVVVLEGEAACEAPRRRMQLEGAG